MIDYAFNESNLWLKKDVSDLEPHPLSRVWPFSGEVSEQFCHVLA
jgi:hypothetical protein